MDCFYYRYDPEKNKYEKKILNILKNDNNN